MLALPACCASHLLQRVHAAVVGHLGRRLLHLGRPLLVAQGREEAGAVGGGGRRVAARRRHSSGRRCPCRRPHLHEGDQQLLLLLQWAAHGVGRRPTRLHQADRAVPWPAGSQFQVAGTARAGDRCQEAVWQPARGAHVLFPAAAPALLRCGHLLLPPAPPRIPHACRTSGACQAPLPLAQRRAHNPSPSPAAPPLAGARPQQALE